jgi:hypothetical protein
MAIHSTWHLLALLITMLATPKIEVSSSHAALCDLRTSSTADIMLDILDG